MTMTWFALLARVLLFAMFPWLGPSLPARPVSREVSAPPRAAPVHSHNDYYRERPLLDALDAGCRSIEADVFLVDGRLLVGHEEFELHGCRTLESLYLAPLAARVRATGGVYAEQPEDEPVLLLIDFKRDGAECHAALRELLGGYRDMLTITTDGRTRWGPVLVVVSGDRPVGAIASESPRLMAVDGRPGDLAGDTPVSLIPLISERWGSRFAWRGEGQPGEQDLETMRSIVGPAHEQGRLVRFWAIPDRPGAWETLRGLGVDLINTDRPAQCAAALTPAEAPAGDGDRDRPLQ